MKLFQLSWCYGIQHFKKNALSLGRETVWKGKVHKIKNKYEEKCKK